MDQETLKFITISFCVGALIGFVVGLNVGIAVVKGRLKRYWEDKDR